MALRALQGVNWGMKLALFSFSSRSQSEMDFRLPHNWWASNWLRNVACLTTPNWRGTKAYVPHNAEFVRQGGRERSFDAYVSHNCEGEKNKKRIIFSLREWSQALSLMNCHTIFVQLCSCLKTGRLGAWSTSTVRVRGEFQTAAHETDFRSP